MIWIAEKSIDAKLNLEVNDDQSTDATAKATDVKEFPPTGGNNNPGFIHWFYDYHVHFFSNNTRQQWWW